MDRITKTHVYFWGDTTFSNWGPSKFRYKGQNFENSEQAFMWEKARVFEDYEIANKILLVDNPSLIKKLGRKVKNFDPAVWDRKSYDIMYEVNMSKYLQNPELKKILLSTGDKTIVEASPYDKVWGVGLHWNDDKILDESNWDGLNLLGKVLVEVRDMINEGME